MLTHKTLEFEWAVPETATLVKKARLRQRLSVYSEPCEGWKLSASTREGKTDVGVYLYPVDLKKETQVAYEIKATPETDKDVCLAKDWIKQKTFQPNTTNGWGFTAFLEEAALKRIGTRKLRINCKITWGDLSAAPTADPSQFFNKAEVSDVALVAADVQPPLFVQSFVLQKSPHFKTILDSEFSEASSTVHLPASPKKVASEYRFRGDVDEFAAFGARKLSGDQQPQQDIAASENDDPPSSPAKRCRLASPLVSVKDEEPVSLRELRLVKVPDCSYATLSAYLAYLYSSKPTIKARAKGRILQNITVETAPFELFSQLSRDYPEFQADVVDFVLANLDEVIATPGWKRVLTLLDEGKIPGGGL
ncbi:hypothetical protein C6P46_004690 [Rhodotorula mucilaginosa]|uniref:BTB domain-containing protein n=1 Tax=Rhodotorula mucilaginosa TaxID=5537 RepID=A0A9P6W0D3_RHOMI|nr:hypothetical protein C6P46_004690 [Rhodotorula mucilaginosa]